MSKKDECTGVCTPEEFIEKLFGDKSKKDYKFSIKNDDGKFIIELVKCPPKDIKERIQTIDDVYELNGTTAKEFDKKWDGFEDHFKYFALEELIVKAYNQDWSPNWSNPSEAKYYPWFKMSPFAYDFYDFWHTESSCSSRLCFSSRTNIEDAASKFLWVYEKSRN